MTRPSLLEKFPEMRIHEREIQTPQLLRWQDSPPVVALSSHLRSWPESGIRLVQDRSGNLCIQARPGVSPIETTRWEFFRNAVALVTMARPDLESLLENGAFALPVGDVFVFEAAKVLPDPQPSTGRGGAKLAHSESRKRNGKRKSL